MIKNKIALANLQETFYRIYSDEFPSFVDTLKSTQNLPEEFNSTLKTIEDNIKKSKTLLAPAGVGAATGGIFGILSKKKAMGKFSGKKLVTIQDSASLFEDTIQRMEQLLEKTQKDDSSQRNYEQLTSPEKKELLSLSEQMKNLSEKLSGELVA